jgi:hypothetical protein
MAIDGSPEPEERSSLVATMPGARTSFERDGDHGTGIRGSSCSSTCSRQESEELRSADFRLESLEGRAAFRRSDGTILDDRAPPRAA